MRTESAVTIFAPGVASPATIYQALADARDATIGDADPDTWSDLTVRMPSGDLVVGRLVVGPDTEGARIVLGMFNWLRTTATPSDDRDRALDIVKRSRTLLGVRVIPPLAERDSRWPCLLAMAQTVGGVLFDGDAVFDADGRPLT